MFICDACGEQQSAKKKPERVVVKTRPKTYVNKYHNGETTSTKVSHGYETVKELLCCSFCAPIERKLLADEPYKDLN
jgi:hypothetical protein